MIIIIMMIIMMIIILIILTVPQKGYANRGSNRQITQVTFRSPI